ncbi:MAG: hypothetical protein PHD48_09530 [Alphaproteobacteria bacterium]|nr:hypothetical protein [Alphaproteobacteria bacterium]
MKTVQNNHSEAYDLANKTANRYGRLALTRAAGEAAAAQKMGDDARHDLWASVVAYLRQTIQQNTAHVAA